MSTLKQGAKSLLREALYFRPLPQVGRYVFVLAQERTGSTVFMDLLNSHPHILADQHLFYTPSTFPAKWYNGRKVFSRKPIRAFKAKVTHTPRQSSVEEVKERLLSLNRSVSIIHLRRRNKLKQAFSAGVCGSTGVQQRLDGKEIDRRPSINIEKFMEALSYYSVLTAFEDDALEGIDHLRIEYERDLESSHLHQLTADSVFDYLGLDSHPVSTRLSRTSSRPLWEYVSNYEAVVEAVRASSYRHLLEEAAS